MLDTFAWATSLSAYIITFILQDYHSSTATNHRKQRMASFSVEEFIGNGILKELLQKLLEEGWDDVPTLKIMSSEDMDLLQMTQEQKVSHHYH